MKACFIAALAALFLSACNNTKDTVYPTEVPDILYISKQSEKVGILHSVSGCTDHAVLIDIASMEDWESPNKLTYIPLGGYDSPVRYKTVNLCATCFTPDLAFKLFERLHPSCYSAQTSPEAVAVEVEDPQATDIIVAVEE